MSLSHSQKRPKAEKIPILKDASDYQKWKQATELQLFRYKVVPSSIDTLTSTRTLDSAWFKKYDRAAFNNAADGLKDDDYAATCFVSALATGDGFHDWLFTMYADIVDSLCDEIKYKVGGVADGDLVSLFENIKLAIRHYEIFNPTELKKHFYGLTMEEHGKNDVMTFLSEIKTTAARLDVANSPLTDEEKMLVLKDGLHQGIFEIFIREVDRNPYPTYFELERALLKESANKKVREKLEELKPGQVRNTLSTRTTQQHKHNTRSPPTSNFQETLEKATTVIANATTAILRQNKNNQPTEYKRKQKCYDFAAGKCDRGSNCRYSHEGTPPRKRPERSNWGTGTNDAGPPSKRQRVRKHCIHHRHLSNHDTSECRNPKRERAKADYDSRNNAAVNAFFDAQEEDEGRHVLCTHVMALPQGARQIDKWCVDGASETNATYDRARCTNIRPTMVKVSGPNSEDTSFFCRE